MVKKAKFNLMTEIHEALMKTATRNGTVKLKRTDVKSVIETTFANATKRAARPLLFPIPIGDSGSHLECGNSYRLFRLTEIVKTRAHGIDHVPWQLTTPQLGKHA